MIVDPKWTKSNFFVFLFIFGISLCLCFLSLNCADEPTSLGLKFLPKEDTTGVRVFDSSVDTMQMISYNRRIYVNTYYSTNLAVGQKNNYNAKGLIKFTNIPSNYDSAVVNSAVLKLKYRNYYFPRTQADSLAQISFDIYTIEQNLNFQTVTLDSVTASTFGTVPQGSYAGSPTADSQEVDIALNTTLVKNWLEYAADPNWAVKNYGIVLSPNAGSNVLKAFYSGYADVGESARPTLQVIVTKLGDTDTLNINTSQTVFLTTTSFAPDPERFFLQAGVSFSQIMRFDISKIPSTATINDVLIYLTIDTANSILSPQTIEKLAASVITDTAGVKIEAGVFIAEPTISNRSQYVFRIITPFQRWLNGETNNGFLIRAFNQNVNLDLFAFYDLNASDPGKRPRVVIKYTPRIHP